MARRNRSKRALTANKETQEPMTRKQTTLPEMPVDDLKDKMAIYPKVSLRITRRNGKGQIATVYGGLLMTIQEVFDLDSWLKGNAGGGEYRVELRDPSDTSNYVVKPFKLHVEGPPRPPKHLGAPIATNPYAEMPHSVQYPPIGMEYAAQPPSNARTGPSVAFRFNTNKCSVNKVHRPHLHRGLQDFTHQRGAVT